MRCCLALALAACSFHSNAAPGDGATGSDGSVGSDGGQAHGGSRTLIVDLGNQTDELDGFPLLVVLDSTRIDYSAVTDPATGFTFTEGSGSSGSALEYDVDHWDPTGRSALWVLVPRAPAGQSLTLTMRYGENQHAANTLKTWNGFAQVLHFDNAGSDAAGTYFQPTPTSVAAQVGRIGSAGGFGSDSQIAFRRGNELYNFGVAAFTLQFWLYLDYASAPDEPVGVLNRGGPLQSGEYDPSFAGGDFTAQWTFANGATEISYAPVPLQQWTHVAVTWDGTTLTEWSNGVAGSTQVVDMAGTTLSTDNSNSDSFVLGCGFAGAIDELELYQQHALPGDWIPAEYRSQSDQAITFMP
jgi:biopolymer transport protein ExbB